MKSLVILKLMLELLGETILLAIRCVDWFVRTTLGVGVLTLIWIIGAVFIIFAVIWYYTGPRVPPTFEPYE